MLSRILLATIATVTLLGVVSQNATPQGRSIKWTHLSTKTGDLPVPWPGKEQTASLVFDADNDGVNDFVLAERTAAPSVVLYRRGKNGWTRYVVEPNPLHIEAGGAVKDIDGDGDLDIVFGGDWKSNEVWWWENPFGGDRRQVTGDSKKNPDDSFAAPWKRHLIKNSGAPKHHDEMFGDFDGDGKDF